MDFLKLYKEEKMRARQALLASKNLNATEQKPEITETNSHSLEKSEYCSTESYNAVANVELDMPVEFRLEAMEGMSKYRIGELPTAFYIPDAFDVASEQALIQAISRCGDLGCWKVLSSRRLQLHGMIPQGISESTTMPKWLCSILSNSNLAQLFPPEWVPNNVLINQYEEDQGILHHTDGPAYKDYVIILSLESDCCMTFKPKLRPSEIGVRADGEVMSVLLQRRSLFIFSNDLYTNHMHGISDNPELFVGISCPCANLPHFDNRGDIKIQRSRRTSITIREAL
jgi:alkylated DNA repair protein alkB family protein 6